MYCNPYLPGIHLSVQKVPNGLDVCIKCISGHNIIFCRPMLWYQSKQDTTNTTAIQTINISEDNQTEKITKVSHYVVI